MDYQAYLKNTGKYQEPVKEEPKEEPKQIDWEQRRYEIARDIYPTVFKASYDDYNIEEIASFAVRYADTLIEELKKTNK